MAQISTTSVCQDSEIGEVCDNVITGVVCGDVAKGACVLWGVRRWLYIYIYMYLRRYIYTPEYISIYNTYVFNARIESPCHLPVEASSMCQALVLHHAWSAKVVLARQLQHHGSQCSAASPAGFPCWPCMYNVNRNCVRQHKMR